jgi:hypothetical protein
MHLTRIIGQSLDRRMGNTGARPQQQSRYTGTGQHDFVSLFKDGDRHFILFNFAVLKIDKTNVISGFGQSAQSSHL